jgi:hypothetical protein
MECDFRVTAGPGGGKKLIMMAIIYDHSSSNNKRSNDSNTHRLKSAILKFRMSRSEVRSQGFEDGLLEDGP